MIIPGSIIRIVSGLFYGWHGNFSSWDEAVSESTGYDDPIILDKTKASALKVRDGLAQYERDSVTFSTIHYSCPLLAGLMWIAAKRHGRINVLDFGGAMGSSYVQNKRFLETLEEVKWCIVEQPKFVEEGVKSFTTERLKFYHTINECIENYCIDVALLSSVLQYLKEPYLILNRIKDLKINYIIIDRTPFIAGKDRITVQKVHPSIYRAKYPCWFFNKNKFLAFLKEDYDVVLEFDALDKANIKSEFKGYILERRSK